MDSVGFEIGVIYEKNSQYYLAISERELLGRRKGQWITVKPYGPYTAKRDSDVKFLMRKWKISRPELDEMSQNYFRLADCKDRDPSDRKASSNNRFINTFRVVWDR